eukprot:scaffold1786_cov181-Skeletonema_marinoi.AAC.6
MLQAKSRTQMKAYNTSWQLKSTEETERSMHGRTRTPKLYVAPKYVGGGRYWGHIGPGRSARWANVLDDDRHEDDRDTLCGRGLVAIIWHKRRRMKNNVTPILLVIIGYNLRT